MLKWKTKMRQPLLLIALACAYVLYQMHLVDQESSSYSVLENVQTPKDEYHVGIVNTQYGLAVETYAPITDTCILRDKTREVRIHQCRYPMPIMVANKEH